jgi:hypothetical protein
MNHEDSNRFIDATSGIKICIGFIGKTHTYITLGPLLWTRDISNIILKGDIAQIIQVMFDLNWPGSFQENGQYAFSHRLLC